MSEARAATIGLYDRALNQLTTFLKHIITPTNMWLLKTSNGRLGNSFLGISVLLLYTVGAKSGLDRVTPLYYLCDGDKIILVGSNGGNIRNPAWVNNLEAQPDARVNVKGREIRVRARLADVEEYQRYWPMVTEMFGKWQEIQDRSSRKFPIMILEPR